MTEVHTNGYDLGKTPPCFGVTVSRGNYLIDIASRATTY